MAKALFPITLLHVPIGSMSIERAIMRLDISESKLRYLVKKGNIRIILPPGTPTPLNCARDTKNAKVA